MRTFGSNSPLVSDNVSAIGIMESWPKSIFGLRLHPSKKDSQCSADRLSWFQAGECLEFGQHLQVGIGQSDCGLSGQLPLSQEVPKNCIKCAKELYGACMAQVAELIAFPFQRANLFPLEEDALGKSPLRLIVKRTWHTPDSFTDTLECGHESILQFTGFGYVEDRYLHRIMPTEKRRRCQFCAAALKAKKPAMSVMCAKVGAA